LDGPDGHEARLRPNQILAVSLPQCPLSPERARAVVRACERALLTSSGLRSLDPADPDYQAHIAGDQASRDQAYHRGTVWAWLAGPFIEAHLRVFGDRDYARLRLQALGDQPLRQGIGTVNEIFEGKAPMAPRGCIAQAWSVAEYLRVWAVVEDFGK
jgi:glycogen debranching enzyme